MQNAKNTEIQERVINLVELYRTKVGKESQAAIELAKEYKLQYDHEIDFACHLHKQGMDGYVLNIEIPEDDIDAIRVNEQLLGHFYKELAGKNADSKVLANMLAEKYDATIYTIDEEVFLKEHFREMVNYIIQTPNNDLQTIEREDRNDIYLIPNEVLELIKSRVDIPDGSLIYNPFTGYAQLANLYPQCSFLCEESYSLHNKMWNLFCDKRYGTDSAVHHKIEEDKLWTWMKIALYANHINATQIENNVVPQTFDNVISYIPFIPSAIPDNTYGHIGEEPDDQEIINKIQLSYQNLPNGGKMVMILPTKHFWKKNTFSLETFWQQVDGDKALKEVIQLPSVLSKNLHRDYCIVILEKGNEYTETTFIDSRFASKKSDNKSFSQAFDLDAFNAMLQNGGKDPETGLRKMVDYPSLSIAPDLLIPQVYVVEGPSGDTPPAILANLCSYETTRIYDIEENLPEDTPWVRESDLTPTYTGPLDITLLKKANCPNNPKDWHFGTKQLSRFAAAMAFDNSISSKDIHISAYRNCNFLDGNKDAVLFKPTKEGIITALVHASGKAIAVDPDIHILYPVSDIDALSLLSRINLPVVYRQLLAYQEFGLYRHLSKILVPMDKRIIYDEILRMEIEESIATKVKDRFVAMKTEYVNEVRMRKHDMRPHMRQLNSASNLMQHYVDNMDLSEDMKEKLNKQISCFRDALHHLSDIIEHLSDEEKFGEPEIILLNEYFEKLVAESNNNGYKVEYTLDKERVYPYLSDKINLFFDHIRSSIKAKDEEYKKGEWIMNTTWGYANIAPLDFDRLVQNIIENACRHGFTDSSRKDYKITINLGVDEKRDMYQIDFSNNGTPLPEGMNKARYGIKGEKAGLRSGTGYGGYIVKSIANHYGGDYDVLCENGKTTIRIYLPIATI